MDNANLFKSTLRSYVVVALLALALFLALPLPYSMQTSVCNQASCKGYEFETSMQHGWYWFGGYHTTVEGFLPKSFQGTIKYAEKYDTIPGWHITALALTAISLSLALYLLVRWILRKR
ncbi:MAG TPA: hypothetical protein VFT16_00600 [Candidatus Saccharimonadales bacterium]|nr:hypothetical protein [Candidatus Saccharimonadales bacterium]